MVNKLSPSHFMYLATLNELNSIHYIVMLFQVQFMLDHLKFILWPEQCSVRFVHGLSTLVLTTNKITFCTQELDFHKRSGIWMESRLIFKENFFCWLASHNLLFVFKYECSGLKNIILIFKGDFNFMSSLGVLDQESTSVYILFVAT